MLAAWLAPGIASAATHYVAKTGNDSGNDCTNQASPCKTIGHGIESMSSGDELIIGDGTYAESITGMPSGNSKAYTTIRAEHDWGVLIDGSGFPNSYRFGINVTNKSYVTIRGLRVRMNQANTNNNPIIVTESHHIKLQRCGASYGPTTGNAASFDIGPRASYVLIEESYSFGGSRYQFVVYQSDHVVVRRSVARNDYWAGDLQCAGFVNYDSIYTNWQNNIVLDSDTAHCAGKLYGGFWNENKDDYAPDTSQTLAGNIVLNVKAFYAADLDWGISGTRNISDMVIWGCSGGYYGNQGSGTVASVTATRMTIGGITGSYDGPNDGAARGTGFSMYGPVNNSLTNSILANCSSVGVADNTRSDFNVFSGNGKNYGGNKQAAPGPNDKTNIDALKGGGLRHLPHVDVGSPLKTAGQSGGQVGAEITYKIGGTGTLYDEPGWNTLTPEPLWPFPNEDQIKKDMASYSGPGAPGARGFTTGKSLDGSDQTLTKYVWEFLGNPIPQEVYGGGVIEPPPTGNGTAPGSGQGADGAGGNGPGGNGPGANGPGPNGAGANGAGAGGADGAGADGGGCGCRASTPLSSGGFAASGIVLALMLARRRRST